MLLILALSAASAQGKQEMFASIPCRCAVDDVRFTREPGPVGVAGGPVVVSIATLNKTGDRGKLEDLTPKERRKLQRQARWAHACEIWVMDEYTATPAGLEAEAERQRARLEKEMYFYMIQHSRPCPECPTAGK